MSGVLWHVTMSLDGFITGPDDAMAWAFGHGSSSLATEVMNETGAILAGRRWYEVSQYGGVGGIYGGAWAGPLFVLTHHRSDDGEVTLLAGPIEEAVATAREAAGGRAVGIFGANVARSASSRACSTRSSCISRRCFSATGFGSTASGSPMIELEMLSAHQAGQLTDLRFRCRSSPR